jgi:hypothetical protein
MEVYANSSTYDSLICRYKMGKRTNTCYSEHCPRIKHKFFLTFSSRSFYSYNAHSAVGKSSIVGEYLAVRICGGRAIAQAVSSWLPTAAGRVRARVWSSWICSGQSGAGAGFLRVLWFSLPIHSIRFSILTITRGRYNRPRINGRRAEWTQFGLHPPLCKLKKIIRGSF